MSQLPLLLVFALFTLNPLTVTVYPRISAAPTTIRITVLTPRHTANRELCLGYRVVGDNVNIRDSCQSMDGDLATRARTVWWSIRVTGEYEAIAALTRVEDGRTRRYQDRVPFEVH